MMLPAGPRSGVVQAVPPQSVIGCLRPTQESTRAGRRIAPAAARRHGVLVRCSVSSYPLSPPGCSSAEGSPTRPHLSAGAPATTTIAAARPAPPPASKSPIRARLAHSALLGAPLQDAAAARLGRAGVLLAGVSRLRHLVGRGQPCRPRRWTSARAAAGSASRCGRSRARRGAYLFGGGQRYAPVQRDSPDRGGRASDGDRAVAGTQLRPGRRRRRWYGLRRRRLSPAVAGSTRSSPGARPAGPRRCSSADAGSLCRRNRRRGTARDRGGSLPTGIASRAVLAFEREPVGCKVIATLPEPTTHAAAAALGRTVFVFGGRGSALGTPSGRIIAVDLPSGRIRPGGRLPAPLSDLAAVTFGRRVLRRRRPRRARHRRKPDRARPAQWSVPPLRPRQPSRTQGSRCVRGPGPSGRLRTGAAGTCASVVYVPNSQRGTVDVIDPPNVSDSRAPSTSASFPQHVVPSWDLRTLYVTNDLGNKPDRDRSRSGRRGRTIPVEDPYNMYFTPAAATQSSFAGTPRAPGFRDAHTFHLHHSLPVPCRGRRPRRLFADGAYLLASCEFSASSSRSTSPTNAPCSTRSSFQGAARPRTSSSPLTAGVLRRRLLDGGVWEIDGDGLRVLWVHCTGAGAHGLYVSRDEPVPLRDEPERRVDLRDQLPRRPCRRCLEDPGAAPRHGQRLGRRKVLWLSGRYNAEVYAISTVDGRLIARSRVGRGPHGLCVWPQRDATHSATRHSPLTCPQCPRAVKLRQAPSLHSASPVAATTEVIPENTIRVPRPRLRAARRGDGERPFGGERRPRSFARKKDDDGRVRRGG